MPRQSVRIPLQPTVLRWARERANLSQEILAKHLAVKPERIADWERTGNISMRQADKLAQKTYTPLGYLYLPEPPDERLPVADYRTIGDEPPARPSPDLLETVYAMQRRQAWMRDELAIHYEEPPLDFVGAFTAADSPDEVADAMRQSLSLQRGWASDKPNWGSALRFLRERIEAAGVLIFVNGVVGNSTKRKLDPDEFRGFALVDEYAPLIFVNNSDFISAQMFTTAHELAHIFAGKNGVSNFEDMQPTHHDTEIFCNAAAAEFLLPGSDLLDFWDDAWQSEEPHQAVARRFKVSVIVAARRALDLKLIDRSKYREFYAQYQLDEQRAKTNRKSGGNFWNSQNVRIGQRFGSAVARAVKSGRLPYLEACSLTGLSARSFDSFAAKLGVPL